MLRHFFLHLIAQGNCASKFKLAAVAIRLSRNEAPKNQVNTGLEEYVEHWKMVSDDIGIEEPNLVRLANPNRLNFEGLEHLIPTGLLKASFLQKSGVTNAMETFLLEEKKNINQNLKKLTNRTSGTEVIQNLDNSQKPVLSTMSKEEFQSKLENWISGTEDIQNLENPQKVSPTLCTQEMLDQMKTMASNMSMDEIMALGTRSAGGPVGPNRTGGPSRLNEGCMDQLTETMASNMSKDENRAVDTGGARGPPEGASGTGVWCNGVWFPTFGETIEDLDDFTNPSMDENQESNGPTETFLKNGASGSEVKQDLNPRKVSLTLPTQNLEGMDQLAETMASSMSMGPKAIKKTKNVAMAGILRQAATRSPSAGVESRADRPGGAGGAPGAKGTRVIQDLDPPKVSSTLSIQKRLDQIKTMASNMSMDENKAVGTEGVGGPVGPNRTVSVESKPLGPGAASAADFAKRVKATPDLGLHLRLRDGE